MNFFFKRPRGRNAVAALATQSSMLEMLERRRLFAARIVGSSATYATIQAAVDAAAAGATITVDAGTYAEKVTVSKTLTINGAQAGVDARQTIRSNANGVGESIVAGLKSGTVTSSAFLINANGVSINGFTIQGETDQSLKNGAGIVIAANRYGTKILNNIVQNNVAGLFLSNNSTTEAAVIQNNLFRNNNNDGTNGGRAIYTNQAIFGTALTNVSIDANTFTNNYGGFGTTELEAAIALEATVSGKVTNIRITSNSMSGNGKAVLAYNAANLLIKSNTITTTQDQYSGTLRFEGHVDNVTIQYNNIYNNTGPAVAVDSKATEGDSSGFVVTFNNFYGNNAAYTVPISVVFEAKVYEGIFDARNNWWGNVSGPSFTGAGTGDGLGAGVFQPGAGLGWKFLPGGSILSTPFSTAFNIQPGLMPTAPNSFTAITSGLTQVTLAWSDTSLNVSTGFTIERSIDGTNFTAVATTAANITRYVDSAVAAGTTYTYRIAATNSNGTSPYSAIAGDSTPLANSSSKNVSTLAWVSATTGYGAVQRNLSVAGRPLTLDNVVYATGLGTHAVSNIVFNLGGGYTNFMSDIGIDAEENGKGTGHVIFRLIGDGRVLYESGVLMNPSVPVSINVNVTGVSLLTLVATNGVADNIDFDHADWAGAKLIAAPLVPTPPSPPSGLTAIASSPTQVTLSWTNNASNVSSFVIQRSTDGTNYTPIATTLAGTTTYVDAGLTANYAYFYRVAAVNSVGTSPFTPVAIVTTPSSAPVTTYLSDLTWTSATTGYGSIKKNLSMAGNVLKIGTTTYTKGIGTHAVSTITYNLAKKYSTFATDVGIDAEVYAKGQGSIIFRVLGDGVVLFDSGVLTNASAPVSINVSVANVTTLTLIATNGIAGSIDYDHADWANARLTSFAVQAPAALKVVAVSVTPVKSLSVPETVSSLVIKAGPAARKPGLSVFDTLPAVELANEL